VLTLHARRTPVIDRVIDVFPRTPRQVRVLAPSALQASACSSSSRDSGRAIACE
jgi:hypothetical protein